MKLLVKFNVVLFLVFAMGLVTTGFVCRRLLQQNAKAEIMENARIMMEAAIAVRTYTSTQIRPLLETQMKYSFLPQSVPAYSYKEATLNPTNPINRATRLPKVLNDVGFPIGGTIDRIRRVQRRFLV